MPEAWYNQTSPGVQHVIGIADGDATGTLILPLATAHVVRRCSPTVPLSSTIAMSLVAQSWCCRCWLPCRSSSPSSLPSGSPRRRRSRCLRCRSPARPCCCWSAPLVVFSMSIRRGSAWTQAGIHSVRSFSPDGQRRRRWSDRVFTRIAVAAVRTLISSGEDVARRLDELDLVVARHQAAEQVVARRPSVRHRRGHEACRPRAAGSPPRRWPRRWPSRLAGRRRCCPPTRSRPGSPACRSRHPQLRSRSRPRLSVVAAGQTVVHAVASLSSPSFPPWSAELSSCSHWATNSTL
jgi:hypothetical protein